MYKFLFIFDLEYYFDCYGEQLELNSCLETYIYECDDLGESLKAFIEDCNMNIKEIYWKSVKPVTILQFVSNEDGHKLYARFNDMTPFENVFSLIENR